MLTGVSNLLTGSAAVGGVIERTGTSLDLACRIPSIVQRSSQKDWLAKYRQSLEEGTMATLRRIGRYVVSVVLAASILTASVWGAGKEAPSLALRSYSTSAPLGSKDDCCNLTRECFGLTPEVATEIGENYRGTSTYRKSHNVFMHLCGNIAKIAWWTRWPAKIRTTADIGRIGPTSCRAIWSALERSRYWALVRQYREQCIATIVHRCQAGLPGIPTKYPEWR